MRRRRHAGGLAEGSFDSFLSTVTKNGLGMLVLVAMASTFSSELTLGQDKFKKNLGTPLVKTAPFGYQAVYFECRGNRVVPVSLKGIDKEWTQFVLAGEFEREGLAQKFNAQQLTDGFFTFHFVAKADEPAFVGCPAVELKPLPQPLGDTIEEVRNPKGKFRQDLKNLDKSKHVVTLFARPDSFAFFRDLREVVQQEEFLYAWYPQEKTLKFFYGLGGGGVGID